ncbi:Asp23/Gls24 family envelope stress response protein [Bacillus sp. WMMC1349]|uniref:Asp23/Gls24 family envelope stress response protein n=1 Tax=Bacillus sp. WMMC1349 TaxID=2736254 RepID=UPI001553F9FC|nr:Asp23/Gls24 family envelope stress response protein [Bacillus sp. WMMC1349]NPC93256.1 Asp23/Gls24 family envelope stress response protein [Bacillus sp. WMMC1349]
MSQEENHLGKVEIAPEVIEVISGIAASEVDGIAEMRGNFATGVVERFGKKNHGKGVKVDLSEEGITIDVYCVVSFGVSIPKIAKTVQDNIRQTLLNMTSLSINEINVHIVGIQFDQKGQEVAIDQEM